MDKTNPIFIISVIIDGCKLNKILPVNDELCDNAMYPNMPTKIYTLVQIFTATLIKLFIFSNDAFGMAW